jgi:hypothetical protein
MTVCRTTDKRQLQLSLCGTDATCALHTQTKKVLGLSHRLADVFLSCNESNVAVSEAASNHLVTGEGKHDAGYFRHFHV